jgi:hypothetical protein
MTVVPLPASPCVRVRLGYTTDAGTDMGSRFFLSYSGAAPSAANCSTLATDIGTAWNTNIASLVYSLISLTEVDVLDITTDSGASAVVTVDHPGTDSSATLVANVATNVEYDIARRYRGGKPRMFLPPPAGDKLASLDKWTTDFIGDVNTGVAAFFAALEALTVGSMGTLAHVNLSYYKGFTNVTNSSGRERAAGKYRDVATLDTVTGYACKAVVGSQRRRRTATTI